MCIKNRSYLERKIITVLKSVNGPVSKRGFQVSAVGFGHRTLDLLTSPCSRCEDATPLIFRIFAGWPTMEPAGSRSAVRNIKDEAARKKVFLCRKNKIKNNAPKRVWKTIIAKITYSNQCPINNKTLSLVVYEVMKASCIAIQRWLLPSLPNELPKQ